MTRDKKLELFESLGSVLWLLLDGFWMLEWSTPVAVLVIPTILCNLTTLAYVERANNSRVAVLIVNAWLLMNVFWILADMYSFSSGLIYAKILFGLSVGLLLFGMIRNRGYRHYVFLVFYRFRRFRMSKDKVDDNVR